MNSYAEFGDKKVELSSNFDDVLSSFRRVRKLTRHKKDFGNFADQLANDLKCIHSCVCELSGIIIKTRVRYIGDTVSPRWPMTDLVINGKSVTGKDQVWEINKSEYLSLINPNDTARFTTKLTVNNYAHGIPALDVRIASGRSVLSVSISDYSQRISYLPNPAKVLGRKMTDAPMPFGRSIKFWLSLHDDFVPGAGGRVKDITVDECFAMYESHHRPPNSDGPVHSSYTLIDLCDLKSALSGMGDYYLKRHLSPSEYLLYRLNYG